MRPLRQNDRGVVLIMTVLILGILVVVAYAFSYGSGVNLHAARHARDSFVREVGSEGALRQAMALLQGAHGGADSLKDTWALPDNTIQVGGIAYAVKIVDEDRKLNLNRAAFAPSRERPFDLRGALNRLVRNLGGQDADFEALCGWIDPASTLGADLQAPKKPLPFISAIYAIPGLSRDLLAGTEDHPPLPSLLSTHPQRVNVNTAPKEVLDALWGQELLTQNILSYRKETPFSSTNEIETLLKRYLSPEEMPRAMTIVSCRSEYFTITVNPIGPHGGGRLTALVRRGDGGAQILSIVR